MSREVNRYNNERMFTDDQLRGNESVALQCWRETLERCGGDGFAAAKTLKREQPAVFDVLERSGKSFEQLCELGSMMSGNDVEGGYF